MSKNKKQKFKFKSIHAQAVIVFILYNVISKVNFAQALIHNAFLYSFLRVYSFGVIATFAFLYFFSHEDFFQFAKDLEKTEKKKEKKYLNKFHHYGKVLGAILIGGIGGPIFAALTLRVFFHNQKIKYPLIFLIIFISTILGFGLIKGFFAAI